MSSTDDNCNTKSDAQTPPKVDGIAQYLRALGAQSCSTHATLDQTNGSMHMGGNLGPLMSVNADASFSTTKSTTDTVGCEQIAAQSNAYNDTVNNVKCQLTSIASSASATAVSNQSLEFCNTFEAHCSGDFSSKQKANITINSIATLSNEDATVIASTVQKGLSQVASVIQDSKNGFGATPQGSKSITDIKTNLTNNDTQNSIKKNASDAVAAILGSQDQKICGKVYAVNCTYDQDMVMTMVAQSIVDTAFNSSFNSDIKTQILQEASTKQKSIAEGAPTAAPPINYAASYSGMNMIMAIGGIFTIIIFGIIVVKIMSQNNKQQNTIDQHAEQIKNDDTRGGRGRYRMKSNKIKLKKYR
jgi:hypothetical protein